MTKVLLCGGAGYIGSHTAVELLAVQAYHLLEVAMTFPIPARNPWSG